jgi:hypothetical protein
MAQISISTHLLTQAVCAIAYINVYFYHSILFLFTTKCIFIRSNYLSHSHAIGHWIAPSPPAAPSAKTNDKAPQVKHYIKNGYENVVACEKYSIYLLVEYDRQHDITFTLELLHSN